MPLTAALLFVGCGNSENFVFTTSGPNPTPTPPAVQAPVAQDDSFAALGNATLNQAAPGVLANDTLNGATITGSDGTGSQGGTIALNQDGSFTYTPALDFVGAETFTYTLGNSAGESAATVTLTSTGLGRFVDNTAPAGGTGTQDSPFDNLADALNVAGPGDTIFVAFGDGNNLAPTGFTLPQGVNLVGEGTGLILAQTIVPQGQAPVIGGPIVCEGDNLIQGFVIDGSTSELIQISNVDNLTVCENTLSGPTNNHIACQTVSGDVAVTNNRFDNPPSNGSEYIYIENTNTNAAVNVSSNTFFNLSNENVSSLCEIYAEGTSALDITFNDNVANGTEADQFEYGLYFENRGTGLCNLTVSGNELSNFYFYPIGLFAFPGPIAGTVSGNTIRDVYGFGIWLYPGGGVLSVSDNVVANTVSSGIVAEFDGPADGTLIVENNNISASGSRALDVGELHSGTNNKVAIRNNTFSDSGSESVEVEHDNNETFCLDITGNTFNDDLVLENDGSGTFNVERGTKAELEAANNFNSGEAQLIDITPVAAGACTIP